MIKYETVLAGTNTKEIPTQAVYLSGDIQVFASMPVDIIVWPKITLIDKSRGKPYNKAGKREILKVWRTIHGRKYHYFDDCAGGG